MVYIPIPDDVIEKGSIVHQLHDISPKIKHDASDLAECLATVIERYPYNKLKSIAETMNSYPGQAAARIHREIYDLLGINAIER
jgi:hypothetical protein